MLTQKLVKELFDYKDGVLVYRVVQRDHSRVGKRAGYIEDGYLRVLINEKFHRVHRVVWLFVNGTFPDQVDHINGVRTDNRIENLREVTVAENNKNKRIPKNNKSGFLGVSIAQDVNGEKRWTARISINKKDTHIGTFKSLSDAVKARLDCEEKYGYHSNHGAQR